MNNLCQIILGHKAERWPMAEKHYKAGLGSSVDN